MKGWVKSANFTGWRVVRAVCTEKVIQNAFHMGARVYEPDRAPITYVWREFCNGIALEQKRIYANIEPLKVPTWEQVFDLTYLANAFYDRGRKILSPHVYKKRKKK